MPINLDNNFWNSAFANAVGTIIATLITGALGFFLFNPLRQWIYKNNPVLARFLLKILDFIYQPVLWIAAFFIFQTMTLLNIYRFLSVAATSIILLRFYFYSEIFYLGIRNQLLHKFLLRHTVLIEPLPTFLKWERRKKRLLVDTRLLLVAFENGINKYISELWKAKPSSDIYKNFFAMFSDNFEKRY